MAMLPKFKKLGLSQRRDQSWSLTRPNLDEYRANPREKKTIAPSQPILARSVENRAGDGHVCALGQPQRETVLSMRSARPRCSHDAPQGHQDTQTVAPHYAGGAFLPANSN